MTFSVSGTAEVLSKLTINASSTSEVKLVNGADTYYPVKWTLKKDGSAVAGAENVTLAEAVAVINALDDNDQAVAPRTALQAAGNYELSWVWAFSENVANDANDTLLGKIAEGTVSAETGTYAGSSVAVQFSITISIEQIQA